MNFFQKLKAGLSKTRGGLTERVDELVENTRVIDGDFYDELTDILILADVGVEATTEMIEELKHRVNAGHVTDAAEARKILKQIVVEEMNIPRPVLKWPMVMFVVGVNGVGKTTTIGKMALRFQEIGRSVMLAAADTFRAAADEQLAIWAERAKVPIIRHGEGADPAAVVYDAVQAAKARGTDLLIVDTAGRLHNKKNLMDELSKMRRIIDREYPEANVRCMLVLDATTGQNGIQQAKQFKEAVEIGGIVLTKLDGTAKGGVAIAIRRELNVPVWYIGVGEGIDDLQAFDARQFADALFGDEEKK
ncbi:MAG: signal recognition particle-docking protein FtsY [Clostridiales bacterium]|nr:signal recognition particle-docking protein FtsY [Clostridiales bacterium]